MSKDGSETTPKFCGNCGQKLIGGATFCAYCGTPIPTIDSAGVVSAKPPSPYTSIPPTVSGRGTPAYPPSYRPERIVREPALPFAQHFQGVLLSPQLEMPRIVKRPNLKHPFLVVLTAGILAGIALIILYSRINITFTDEFYTSMGYTPELSETMDIDSLMQMSLSIGAFFSPLGFLFNWIILNTLILWILHAIISSQVPPSERNYRTMATITGWAFLPHIFEEAINVVLTFLFVPTTSITVNSLGDLAVLDAYGLPSEIGFILSLFSFVIQIWSVVIVYFAVKSIDPIGNHAIGIAIGYAIIPYVLSYILSYFLPFGLPI